MYVCRRWYDIAVREQQLWGNIEISSSNEIGRLAVLLKRSGLTPLSIKIPSADVMIPPSLLLQHSERLQDLDLTGAALPVHEFLELVPKYGLPLLRSIKLHPISGWGDVPSELLPIALPDALFDGRAPRLTALEMSYLTLNWNLICGFTSISLTSVRNTHSPTTILELLSMLEASPALTYLQLQNVIIPSPTACPTVSLPLLESIYLQDGPESCNQFLRHIVFPPSAQLSVMAWNIRRGSELVDLLVPIRQHLRAPSAPAVHLLQLQSTAVSPEVRPNLTVRTYTAVSEGNILDDAKSLFHIQTYPETDNLLRQIMAKILKTLSCASITHLDCRSATHLTLMSWKAVLDRLPALEKVYLGMNISATRFFNALAELTEKSTGAYPPVRYISLVASEGRDEIPSILVALRVLLSVRHIHGVPIERLELDESLEIEEDSLAPISELVRIFVGDEEVHAPLARRGGDHRENSE
ncbi:hypothetical protein B0H19DRAFT_1181723 [Mycena capillaripes]|nr:hypothetical protein B0H19DRAFT_1181723 [Mycena capillaripes]